MKYLYKKIQKDCPLCSSQKGLLLYEMDSEKTAAMANKGNLSSEKLQKLNSKIQKLWKGKKCAKVLCADCSFVYADPFVGGDQEFYDFLYSSADYPDWKWDYEMTLNAIKKIKGEKSYFEIGAGKGAFAKVIAKFISRENIFCLEYSEAGRREIEQNRIRCSGESFLNFKSQKKYSIVCLFQVLEHLEKIHELFDKLEKMTTPDAHIFITTPARKTIEFNEQHNLMLDLPPNHVGGWNKKSFETISKMHNFEVVDFKLAPYPFFRKILDIGLGKFENRKMQKRTIAFKINKIQNKKFRKLGVIFYLFFNLPETLFLALTNKIAQSQWVHLRKVIK